MKHAIQIASAALGILVVSSCGKPPQEAMPAPAILDGTSILRPALAGGDYTMIRTILNAPPAKVSKILGEPDATIRPSRDCDYLPSCSEATYQKGKFEALFSKNRLKWLTLHQAGLMIDDLLPVLGLRSCPPTLSKPASSVIAWRSAETRGTATGPLLPIEGIREIVAFPDYVLIMVAVDYDDPF